MRDKDVMTQRLLAWKPWISLVVVLNRLKVCCFVVVFYLLHDKLTTVNEMIASHSVF